MVFLGIGIRQFHNTAFKYAVKGPKFNTQLFIEDIIKDGKFTEEQAQIASKIIADSINDGIELYASNLISREVLNKMSYKQKVDFAKLKGELQMIDKSDFNSIKNENERLRSELEKMRIKFKEEINKSLSSVRLDLSLEKGRIREESSIYDLKIKETDTRINQEIYNLKVQIDSVKTTVLQWLFGVCAGTFSLVLAYARLVS
ncbi:hypothetical protein C6P40_002004 [Pichia californica]|uniref:DUF1640 domain-containing protein n=1 Tax=Pichia californica TaxID=460514 RepID=A0A9P6WIB9_9ASCO|nr:hypothetical protein C6P42_002040 [[Candida] californica]KAG0687681.1 hypothetical protein C6P40_002004 [[Candida] californica]